MLASNGSHANLGNLVSLQSNNTMLTTKVMWYMRRHDGKRGKEKDGISRTGSRLIYFMTSILAGTNGGDGTFGRVAFQFSHHGVAAGRWRPFWDH